MVLLSLILIGNTNINPTLSKTAIRGAKPCPISRSKEIGSNGFSEHIRMVRGIPRNSIACPAGNTPRLGRSPTPDDR